MQVVFSFLFGSGIEFLEEGFCKCSPSSVVGGRWCLSAAFMSLIVGLGWGNIWSFLNGDCTGAGDPCVVVTYPLDLLWRSPDHILLMNVSSS